MKSLVAIQAQIQDLQKQAAELRTREFRKTLAEIVAQMKAADVSRQHSPSLQRSSGNHIFSKVRWPESFVSQSPTEMLSSFFQLVTRAA